MKLSKLNISISAFPVGSRYDFPSNTALHACHQISFSYEGGWKPCSYLLSPHRAVFVNESFLYGMHSSLHVMQGGGGLNWKHGSAQLDRWMWGKENRAVGHPPAAQPISSIPSIPGIPRVCPPAARGRRAGGHVCLSTITKSPKGSGSGFLW